MNLRIICLTLALMAAHALSCLAQVSWRTKLEQKMPLLGHRNWIVIADSAYPWQTAKGIDTVSTGEDQLTVIKAVLDTLSRTKHVQPVIYTDAELKHVPERHAQGISAYREDLARVLGNRSVQLLPHEKIISKLDEAGNTFHVLLLKTRMTLPYTSVFVQLECGYWNAEAEKSLRQAIQAAGETQSAPRQ